MKITVIIDKELGSRRYCVTASMEFLSEGISNVGFSDYIEKQVAALVRGLNLGDDAALLTRPPDEKSHASFKIGDRVKLLLPGYVGEFGVVIARAGLNQYTVEHRHDDQILLRTPFQATELEAVS